MVRIGISVEGATEERFVKTVLAPYLSNKNIYLTPISLGGKVNLDRIKSEVKKLANNFDKVTTFYDFYGFQKKAMGETKSTLEKKIMKHVHQSIQNKIIPYIQMYEFEGLLLSCPESIELTLNEKGCQKWAENVLNSFDGDPEKVNDSPETAPSKRFQENTGYRKTTHGPNIAKAIGIDKIRKKCTGFNEWLTKLEALAI